MSSAADDYPPHALRDYALIADGHRGGIVGPRGDVAWLCAPRWDSGAVLAALIGGPGVYAVTPVDTFVWGGYYEPGSLIWRSRWVTTSTSIECREALAYPGDPDRVVLLRRVIAGDQPAAVDVVLELRAEFGHHRATRITRHDDGRWTLTSGSLRARWSGAESATVENHTLRLRLEVPAGGSHDLVLEISDQALPDPVDVDQAWRSTETAWRSAVPAFERSAAPRDSALAYAVLRGMTAPGGGMVAAATLGLPERAGAGRNYDYRYVWLRDQAYAGIAAGVEGAHPLMDEAVAFTTARVLEHGDQLVPAYRLDGTLPPHESTLDLPGYPGGRDVVGNWVRGQFQLDSMGEILQLYATSARHDHLQADDIAAAVRVIDIVDQHWDEPEAGVWELDDDWWVHSRLACVAGLRSIARQLGPDESGRASTLADTILAETSRRGLGADGAWLQRPGHPGVDAALLLPPVRGGLSPTDPRSLATLRAVQEQLCVDGYVYRYAVDQRPLGEAEGAFLMCGFALSLAQLAAGHEVEAMRSFERQRSAPGSPGLFAEEFDVTQHQLRGNLPQAFVHALGLEVAQRLGMGAA
jgi:Glycosyl hydrolases family 15/Trehalase-like, N-terminal